MVDGELVEIDRNEKPKRPPLTEKEIRIKTAQMTAIAKRRHYSNPHIWAKKMVDKEIAKRG